jgi:phospholipase/carboxylesterase
MVFGYSHGANRAASLIQLHPHYLAGAVLFPGLMPLLPDLIRNFSHVSVFIGAAHLNPIIPSGQAGTVSYLSERKCEPHHLFAPGPRKF